MTISSTITKSGPYAGNDVTTVFAYAFQIFADADLQVVHTDASDVETILTLTTDYTVSGAGDAGGGSITYPVSGSPLPAGEKITIISDLTVEQETDLSNQGGFFPEVHETVFDKLCRMIQQHAEKFTRVLVVPVSSSTAPEDLVTSLIASEANAAASAAAAALSYTTFDDRYLGSKSTPPTTLNDLVTTLDASHDGIEYWNSTSKDRWTWNGGTLSWGLTSSSVATSANLVSVSDAGGYYAGTDVEAVLQELAVFPINTFASVGFNGLTEVEETVPSFATRITMVLSDVSLDTIANLNVMLRRSSGGYSGSGYDSVSYLQAGSASSSTSEIRLASSVAIADSISGILTLLLTDPTNNTWSFNGIFSTTAGTTRMWNCSGSKTEAVSIDGIKLIISAGNGDAGQVRFFYE